MKYHDETSIVWVFLCMLDSSVQERVKKNTTSWKDGRSRSKLAITNLKIDLFQGKEYRIEKDFD